VTEMEPREEAMDGLLRVSLAGPVPSLPPDFAQRLVGELSRSSHKVDRYGRILLAGYALLSVVACAVVMRGHGLDWGAITPMILGPLAVAAGVPWALRRANATLLHSAKER
jgi:hypothetical protein